MISDLEIPFDQVTYRDGQLLTALDIGSDQQRDDRLSRLHMRYLHDTWGIALGFEVTQVIHEEDGIKRVDSGGAAVSVGPGYAVDIHGRPVLLSNPPVSPSLPKVNGHSSFVLTVSYQDGGTFRSRSELESLCLSSDFNPRHERPVFAWKRPATVRIGPQIPLVQINILDGIIQGELDFRVRRYTQPIVRPHMAWGTTEKRRTGWKVWTGKDDQPLGINRGLEAKVDTSDAGFTKNPFYFAILDRRADEGPNDSSNSDALGTESTLFLDGLRFVTDTDREGFTYRIFQPDSEPLKPGDAETLGWSLVWLGVEPVTGCEPKFDELLTFTLAGFPAFPFFQVARPQSRTKEV